MRYRARFTKQGQDIIETRWYETQYKAQDALKKHRHVGPFQYLGMISGDVREKHPFREEEWCHAAPRNGGLVTLQVSNHLDIQKAAR